MRPIALLLLLAGCASSAASSTNGLRDPRSLAQFLRDDEISDVKISPDGETLAVMSNATGETRLAFLRTRDLQPIGGFRLTGIQIFHRIAWANESRLVAELASTGGALSIPQLHGEIMAINSDGTNQKLIFGYRRTEMQTGSNIQKREDLRAWGWVIDTLPDDKDRVLVMAQHFPSGVEPGPVEAYLLDIFTGLRTRVAGGPNIVAQYLTDETHKIRLAVSETRNAKYEGFWRDEQGEWTQLDKLGHLSREAIPIGLSSAKRTVYLVDEDDAGPALFAMSIDDGSRTVVTRERGTAPRGVWFDEKTGTPVAVEFEPDYPKWKIIDKEHSISKILKLAFEFSEGRQVRIISYTPDQTQAIVLAHSDQEPSLYLLVRSTDGTVKPLFTQRPASAGAPMKPIHITTSDGVEIRGYLTLPKNAGPIR